LRVELTVDGPLENALRAEMNRLDLELSSVVMLRPQTGEVLAMVSTDDHRSEVPLSLQSSFPAASLFKIVTAAAAIELGGLDTNSLIAFRGGSTRLNKSNYMPDSKLDSREISLSQAMARSNNPAFARLAVTEAGASSLEQYARSFGIGNHLPFEVETKPSSFPDIEDNYDLARVGAGFGKVLISPLQAAVMAQTLANDGVLVEPWIVKEVSEARADGKELTGMEKVYSGQRRDIAQAVLPSTAKELRLSMLGTTKKGTARKAFSNKRHWELAAKTGTLSGDNPKGRYHWFIANFPAENPEVSIASLVIDRGGSRINGSGLARRSLEIYQGLKSN